MRISHEEYILWRDLIQDRIGLNIKENQLDFLRRRLRERMSRHSINTYSKYYDFITKEDENFHEWQELIELLVNFESGFMRHMPSFNALMDKVLPELVNERIDSGEHQLFMWSAGCSRGQEAYSLAMAFVHARGNGEEDTQVRITATDISRNALSRAKKGEYSLFETRDMPKSFRDIYMTTVKENNLSTQHRTQDNSAVARHRVRYRVRRDIRENVRFGFLNFINTKEYWISMQDVIFCQNVFIYFNIEDRARIILMLLKCLRPGGYLFLAPGEAIGIKTEGAAIVPFKNTLAYKRNTEAVHVRIAK